MGACVARKQRVETYLDATMVEQIEQAAEERGISVSQLLREAARKEIQREELDQ